MHGSVLNVPESTIRRTALRQLYEAEEMRMCVDLQKSVWGFSDLEVVPLRMYVVAVRTGGQVIGAFDGQRLIGFALAVAAHRNNELYLHSHMTAVLPEYQNQGIGRRLKLAQRDDALSRGISLIEWTFDPLQVRNAHFNIARLGAIVREYLPNVYGCTSSPLHHGLPTDRLVAQWWIREPRVEHILSRQLTARVPGQEQVSIPRNVLQLCEQDRGKARDLQSQVRQKFQQLFAKGFAVTDFELDTQDGKYLLQRI